MPDLAHDFSSLLGCVSLAFSLAVVPAISGPIPASMKEHLLLFLVCADTLLNLLFSSSCHQSTIITT